MTVETVADLAETLADWIGVFGCCKNVKTDDDLCTFDPEKPTCCRTGLVEHLKTRITQAAENEQRLSEMFGDNFREVLIPKDRVRSQLTPSFFDATALIRNSRISVLCSATGSGVDLFLESVAR